jgi:glyoxylase-like metal-dependent hydrolase (beta-lactamase superfamily II)
MEKGQLENSEVFLPMGLTLWGKILAGIMSLRLPFIKIPPAHVDITLNDGEYSLDEFGVNGWVIPTPGHSPGSVSILLENGNAFVGDLAMNGFPLRFGPGFPIFGDDLEQVKKSWRNLIEKGAKMVFPSHGEPFHVEKISKYL